MKTCHIIKIHGHASFETHSTPSLLIFYTKNYFRYVRQTLLFSYLLNKTIMQTKNTQHLYTFVCRNTKSDSLVSAFFMSKIIIQDISFVFITLLHKPDTYSFYSRFFSPPINNRKPYRIRFLPTFRKEKFLKNIWEEKDETCSSIRSSDRLTPCMSWSYSDRSYSFSL